MVFSLLKQLEEHVRIYKLKLNIQAFMDIMSIIPPETKL